MPKTAIRLHPGLAMLCNADRGYRPITKLLLAMKLTIILLTTILTGAYATGLSQSVTFSGKEVPIKKVFEVIEQQTGYVVFANRDVLDGAKPVTISADNMPLTTFLQAVMKDQPYEFLIEGKTIVLSLKKEIPPPITVFEMQGRTLYGIVFDEKTYSPLPAVTVSVNGTNKATQTNEKGEFIFKGLGEEVTLTLTSIGYEKQVVKVPKTDPVIRIMLKVATSELDQAVVQAYGITSKRLATGNITKVTGEEIRMQPVMNPLLALQGRVPGLVVTQLSGQASSPVKLVIRGRSTINPNALTEPLYVIDGVPQAVLEIGESSYNQGVSAGLVQGGISWTQGQSPFFHLNPNDIESIEVLKDADATAMYGSRGANGVVMITTRKAKPGPTALNMQLEQGFTLIPRYPNKMDLREYLDMRYEAFRNDGITPTPENAPDLVVWDTTRATDWYKEMLKAGKITNVQVSLSGGDNRTTFRLSGAYRTQVDLNSPSGGNKVGSISTSISHISIDRKLSIDFRASYAASKVDVIRENPAAYDAPPNAPPIFTKEGNLNYADWATTPSSDFPFAYLLQPNIQQSNVLNASMSVQYTLLKGLALSASLEYNTTNNNNNVFLPIASQFPSPFGLGTVSRGQTKSNNLTFGPQVRYTRTIAKGSLLVLVGGSVQSTNTSITTNLAVYNNDDLMKSLSNALFISTTDNFGEVKFASLFGRINFNWDNKYVLNLQGRRDGSSKFAPDKQYGNFGSVGASWIATEEAWLRRVTPSWISLVKFQGSAGITGDASIGDYAYLPRYGTSQPGSPNKMYTYNGVQPYVSIIPVNQSYRWGEQKSVDLGTTLGFLEDRLTMTLSWYQRRSGNQLTEIPTPSYTGFQQVIANWTATVQNRGLEASLGATIVRKKDLQVTVNANISRNTNKLIAYPGIEQSPYSTSYKVGQSLDIKYTLRLLGVDPLTGDYSYEDYNKDGFITSNSNDFPGTGKDDRYIPVNLAPKFTGGFGSNIIWKKFSLAFQFSFKNQLGAVPDMGISVGRRGNLTLPSDMAANHWRKPGDVAKYPRYSTTALNGVLYYVSTSYLSLNSVGFSYSMPEKLTKKAGLQACNLSLNMSNLFTITSYGADPELQRGSFVPIPRNITGTLSITL